MALVSLLLLFGVGVTPKSTQSAKAPFELAITIDDLPFAGEVAPGDSKLAAEVRIVEALRKHAVPASGFVTCQNVQSPEQWDPWVRARVPLENHSTAHQSVDAMSASDWEIDLKSCGEKIALRTHRAPQFYRFPFLMTGSDATRHEAVKKRLEALKLRVAPVSIDTADWTLAKPYVAARASKDETLEETIQLAYQEHVLRAVRHYRAVGRLASAAGPGDSGHEVRQIILLHANAVMADGLDRLLTRLEGEGARFVPLDRALADPVYQKPDGYLGKVGMSWLYRVLPDSRVRWNFDRAEEAALLDRFSKDGLPPEGLRLDAPIDVFELEPGLLVVRDATPLKVNAMVAQMADGSVLIAGSTWTPEAMAVTLEWLKARFGEQKVVAIDTHHHWDAAGGNQAVIDAGGEVWAPDLTAQLLGSEEKATQVAVSKMVAADDPKLAERFAHFHVAAPQHTFPIAAGKTFTFGGEQAKVIFPGPSHAQDTVAVWLPRRKALFGGCALVEGERPGNLSDANLGAWPQAVHTLESLGAQWVVSGHGDRRDPSVFQLTLDAVRRASVDAGH